MRNQRGITLIALIVTIIVLIIIAGISIATLTSDNGILRQVDSAKVASIEGTAREEVTLAMGALRIAIAQAQSQDNSYQACDHAGTIQLSMLKLLNNDTQLSDKAVEDDFYAAKNGWTATKVEDTDVNPASAKATFTVKYTGDDYQNACNDGSADIVYTIALTQSSIECIDIVAKGITAAGTGSVVKPTDIGANALVNGLR